MPVFVHLTPHSAVPAIRRGGIAPGKRRGLSRGVYAMPVTPSFQISHQWLRELRRGGGGTIVAVYFRIPDDEPVEIGHYNQGHLPMTAAEAVAVMLGVENNDPAAAREADANAQAQARRRRGRARSNAPALPTSPEGFEVIIPRRIAAAEILRIAVPPQVVGWRYSPCAKGRPPCACLCCERGNQGVQKLALAAAEAELTGRRTKATIFGLDTPAYERALLKARGRRKKA